MKFLGVVLAVLAFASFAGAQKYQCPKDESQKTIKVNNKAKLTFMVPKKTPHNMDCEANYVMNTCSRAKLQCAFKMKAKGKTCVGDKAVITNKGKSITLCNKKGKYKATVTGDFSIRVSTDAKKGSKGGKCSIRCIKKGKPKPTTTTAAPTPPPTTAPTPAPVPCVNCTTTDAKPCQFPFIWQNITFTSCTSLNDNAPWCATEVDSLKNFIAGPNSYGWGYCSSSCPGDSGYPDSGDGPACEVQTTGLPFPTECEDRLARTHKNILFLGNSYTYGNDLPGMVKNLASAAGKSASTTT